MEPLGKPRTWSPNSKPSASLDAGCPFSRGMLASILYAVSYAVPYRSRWKDVVVVVAVADH